MRLTLIALAAALAASAAAPAAACEFFQCADLALADDSYPPGDPSLPPTVRALVAARHGQGLSLAAFYNDPALALARRYYAPVAPVYVEAPGVAVGYGYRPHVIASRYGHGRRIAHRDGPRTY